MSIDTTPNLTPDDQVRAAYINHPTHILQHVVSHNRTIAAAVGPDHMQWDQRGMWVQVARIAAEILAERGVEIEEDEE